MWVSLRVLLATILIDPCHDYQGGSLQHVGITALFTRHGQKSVGQSDPGALYHRRVVPEIAGHAGPCVIECMIEDLQSVGSERGVADDAPSFHGGCFWPSAGLASPA